MMQFFEFDGAAVAPQPDESLFEYWMSYAPVAPLLGLEYRPAKIFSFQLDTAAPEAPVKAKRVKKPVQDAEVVSPAKKEAAPVEAPVAAEPVAETPVVEEPLAEAPVAEAVTPDVSASDLVQIKGIGPKLQTELNALGLITVAQLAEYTDAQVAELCEAMTSFKDRPVRDDWVGQAKALVA